nr:MAG TPA: hypothetical protein [Caudoviricetes sp.]
MLESSYFFQKSCLTEEHHESAISWLFVLQKGGRTWNLYHR